MAIARQRPEGPVERWLTHLLGDALPSDDDLDARITSVDISPAPGRGEIRAYVKIRQPSPPDRTVWQRVAHRLAQDPAVARVVPIPPSVYVTLAPGVLEQGLIRSVREPLVLSVSKQRPTVVVFCSPNTNKPLHIGHLRACFLGMSMRRLLEATGVRVASSQMLSNFGVHMCQALAMDDGSCPMAAGLKGDHFVGGWYRSYHEAVAKLPDSACDGVTCADQTNGEPCLRCRPLHLLRQMAEGDMALLAANERLGNWTIEGILSTQARIGTVHDSAIREDGVIALAKQTLQDAVEAGVCVRRLDGSIYIPIRRTGDTELTLLRRDGTSLVFSMLLGVYLTRSRLYPGWEVLELTGEQWRSGRTAMYEVLERIGRPDLSAATEGVFFGMVQLAGQVMQSRSGYVVAADDLLDRQAAWVADWAPCSEQVRTDPIARDRLGVAALKYHLLKFPRQYGLSFDEVTLRADLDQRLTPLVQALEWARLPGSDSGSNDLRSPQLRPLALLLARQAAAVHRAVAGRDPAVLVRYLDEVVEKALGLARSGSGAPPSIAGVLHHVLRSSLAMLDITAADLGCKALPVVSPAVGDITR